MTHKVSMRHPHFPEDYEFGVAGIGVLKNNGVPVEVDEKEFKSKTGKSLEEAFANNATITVEGSSKSAIPFLEPTPVEEGSEE